MPLSDNLIIIITTCLISWLGFNDRSFLERWCLNPYQARRRNRLSPYLSYGFVHADFSHLLFNMITLFFFGNAMEGVFKPYFNGFGYYLFYLGGMVFAILPSALLNRDNARYSTLGASGAVSAVLFAYILLRPWSVLYVYFIPVPAILYAVFYIAYSMYSGRNGSDNVNHSAHLWGAAYGVCLTVLLVPQVLSSFLEQLFRW
jgi:membrane associated rhomboid family serine protease